MQSLFRATVRSRQTPFAFRGHTIPRATHPNLGIRTLITKRYTKEHETVTFDDETGIGIITITDHAQSTLGDVVFVELPSVGRQVEQGESVGAVESVKAASDIYSPVSGTIEEVNEALGDKPGLLNRSAEQDGWLCKIRLSDPSQMEKLLTEEAYAKFVEEN